MTWVLVAVGAWLLCSVIAALLIGRSIRLADRKACDAWERERAEHEPNFVAEPGDAANGPGGHGVRTVRPRVARD